MSGNKSLSYWTQKALCGVGAVRTEGAPQKDGAARRPPTEAEAEADPELAAAIKASLVTSPMNLDLTVICHEARGLDLASGKQAYVSVSDLRCGERPGEVTYSSLGAACNLRTLELDTTLLLRVCVDENDDFSGSAAKARTGERRILGEVRLPLSHLIKNYNSCLYYTWVALEQPGLFDSVTSLGDFTGGEGGALDQAITQGPKQLSQPRACISVCKSADIGPTGKIMWAPDTAAEARAVLWGPLLRSQQQHVVLSAMLHLKCERQGQQSSASQGYPSSSKDSKALAELQDLANAQEQENARLKAELETAQSQLQSQRRSLADVEDHDSPASARHLSPSPTPSPRGFKQSVTPEREQLRAALVEIDSLHAECDRLKADNHDLNLEIGVVSSEANVKIEQANDRIRTLRLRIEEGVTMNQRLSDQNIQYTEQNQVLRSICEDFKRICENAGLQAPDHSSMVAEEIDNTVRNLCRLSNQDLDNSFP